MTAILDTSTSTEHASATTRRTAESLTIAGVEIEPTPAFDTYWRFAAKRQTVYEARLCGRAGPWTDDPVINAYRFTNCFRASDRVSQYLIRNVIYRGPQDPAEVVFRTLLFKFFNRVSTWPD